MKSRIPAATLPAMLMALMASAQGEIVSLTPGDINGLDTNTTSFSDANVTLTPLIAGTPDTFNGDGDRLGIDDQGSNNNAFNDPDTDPNNGNEEQLQLQFSANSGLTQIAWDFSRADGPGPNDGVIISGFLADPGATLAGATGAGSVSYNSGTGSLNVQVSGVNFGNPDGFLDLAVPSASAGQTLLLTVTDTTQAGAQLAITGISYEDALVPAAPVITTGLPATFDAVIDTTPALSVVIDGAALPAPSYLWELDSGGGFVSVGTDAIYSFTPGPATNGTYRVTVSNSEGSDTSTTVVTAVDDSDGINNQWEIDNFGDYLLYDETDDVDTLAGNPAPDGRNNFQEWTDGTDPNNPDSDNDGLTDAEEVTNSTNPLLPDSDGDGYGDGYEVNTSSTSPNDVNDTPGVDDGRNSIGITFASTRGGNPNVNLGNMAFAGAPGYSQKNWNTTGSLGDVSSITELDIAAPISGALSDSSGVDSGATFLANFASTWSTTFNPLQPIGGLLSGYLFVDATTTSASFEVASIPYSRYDVVVYFVDQNGSDGGAYTSESINNLQYDFAMPALVPRGTDPVWYRSADQSNTSNGTTENFPKATHLIFRGLSDSSITIFLDRINTNVGLAAIQIVEALDSDGDGMGDFYELSVGLDPNNDGTTPNDPKEGATGQFDGDGIDNLTEHNDGTNPNADDTDGDGYTDDVESDLGSFLDPSDTGTDPRIADVDADGLLDGVETNTGVFVSVSNTGTDPFVDDDADFDGYRDTYEVLNGPTDPFDAESPGGPNPNGFALAFNALIGAGNGPNVEFGGSVYAGAPGVEMKNWNRTFDLANNAADASGDVADIETPSAGQLVDSSGTTIGDGTTGLEVTYAGGFGAYSFQSDANTPYGRLYNSFIFGRTVDPENNPDASVTFNNIPYANYDVYVYFGSEINGRTGTISSSSAGVTYSFTTAANNPTPGIFTETTDTGTGFPAANYAVFRNQTSPNFDVKTTTGAGQFTMGIFGVQVVESTPSVTLKLTNPQKSGSVFNADFTTDTAGTFIFERSTNLLDPWSPVGSPVNVAAPGTQQVSDPAAPVGKAFYRVREQ